MDHKADLPEITHLQWLILNILIIAPQQGRDLRERLREHGERKSAPAFYQTMARLEEPGLVKGWYEQEEVGGQLVRVRHYKILGKGRNEWTRTRDFYLSSVPSNGVILNG